MMRFLRLLPVAILACQLAWSDDAPKTADKPDSAGVARVNTSAGVVTPPVMRPTEPKDNVVLTLPGPKPKPVVVTPPPPQATVVHLKPPAPDPEKPVLRRVKAVYPEGFEKDSAEYLKQRLGAWNEANAKVLLGQPVHSRPAYGDDDAVNGQIYAFDDPTGHYKSLELDFDKATGRLRTVFVYPIQMTWQDCRRTFGASVRSTQANKGRTFYSYSNRRMDVLVDPGGKVISLGMY